MKKLARTIAVTGLMIGTPAFAADMAVKAPAPAPAPVYNWTGGYIGLNAGASMGNVKTDFNAGSVEVTTPAGGFFDTPGLGASDRTYPDGFIGGGQIGYNWQYSPLIVVGLEADFQGALERDNGTLTNNFTGPLIFLPLAPAVATTVTGSTVLDYQTKIDWFGTVRARLGYVWGNGEVMSYVTGGLAYGKVGINGTSTVSGTVSNFNGPFSNIQAFGQSHVNTGWVVGYGNEGHLPLMPGNWTWKVETLYMDLGHLDTASTLVSGSTAALGVCIAAPCTGTAGASGGGVTTHSHFTDWILRGGLNYHF